MIKRERERVRDGEVTDGVGKYFNIGSIRLLALFAIFLSIMNLQCRCTEYNFTNDLKASNSIYFLFEISYLQLVNYDKI